VTLDAQAARANKLVLGLLTLDVKQAFPPVQPRRMAQRVAQAGYPLGLATWVETFLSNRTVTLNQRTAPA